jgi:hypothetical protein
MILSWSEDTHILYLVIYIVSVNGKLRTVRFCGYLPAENDQLNCVHRSGTYEVHVNYCACKGNLCNGAITPRGISISLLLLPLFVAECNIVL